MLGVAGAYVVMLRSTIDGRTAVGTFTAASIAAVGLSTAVVGMLREASRARRSSFYMPSAMRVLGLAKADPRLDLSGTAPARPAVRTGIRFEGVSFTYPGTDRLVLDRLDLDIEAGTSIALVGENGAGKTTLIKLLCRFYDPTEGRITIDGTDIRQLDLDDYRSRLAVIFQDFVHYNLPARDNVGFGALARAGDDSALREAASRVGILEQIEALPDGWDTALAREFGGVDLSGGEWQRVALARAMMAQAGRDSDLLVLDEPTASLDVRIENELYGHFAELSRGKTTLLVSHRFSTVRMAGRIVLLAGGRVVEDGSHDELIAAGGRYAELYEVQASHYRLTGSSNERRHLLAGRPGLPGHPGPGLQRGQGQGRRPLRHRRHRRHVRGRHRPGHQAGGRRPRPAATPDGPWPSASSTWSSSGWPPSWRTFRASSSPTSASAPARRWSRS